MTRPKRNHHSASDRPTYAPTRAIQRTSSPTWCAKHDKRKYTSRAQALKAGEQKYGTRSNAYPCPHCATWHLTRRDTRLDVRRVSETSANEAAEALVAALFGEQAANDGGEG